MTNEEAKEIMSKVSFYWQIGEQTLTQNQINEALDLAIKALEPYEDCISRQAAIDAIYKRHIGGKDAIENAPINDFYACGLEEAVDAVWELPSVTPKAKMGRWMRWYEVIESADGKSTDHIPHCKCAECGTEYDPHSSQFIKYCHNCGAMMQEVENDGE